MNPAAKPEVASKKRAGVRRSMSPAAKAP